MSADCLSTKVTQINGTWICCILKNGKPWVETVVKSRKHIQPAFRGMFRMIDKLGYVSPMAAASRLRDNLSRNCDNLSRNRDNNKKDTVSFRMRWLS